MATKINRIRIVIQCLCIFFLSSSNVFGQESLPLKAERFFTIKTDEGTFMDLDVSSADGSIVFSLLGNIFLLERNGTEARQLTKGIQWDSYPTFSPDGEMIAFISDRSGVDNIYTMSPIGTNITPVTRHQTDHTTGSAEWLNSGKAIRDRDSIYSLDGSKARATVGWSYGEFPDNQSFGYSIFGKAVQRYKIGNPNKEFYLDVPDFLGSRPAISPDGKYLAYVSLTDNGINPTIHTGTANVLRVFDLISGKEILAKKITNYQHFFPRFTFDNDSRKIVIPRDGRITQIDIFSGEERIIPFNAAVEMELAPLVHHPQVLPLDSIEIKYMRNGQLDRTEKYLYFSSLSGIQKYNLEAGKVSSVIKTKHGQFFPVLTNDGQKIIYSSWNRDGKGFIYEVDLKDFSISKILKKPGLYKYLAVHPSGEEIAFLEGKRHYYRSMENFINADLKVLDISSGNIKTLLRNVPFKNKLTFNGDDLFLIGGKTDKGRPFINIDIKTKEKRDTIGYFPSDILQATISPDKKLLFFLQDNIGYITSFEHISVPFDFNSKNVDCEIQKITGRGMVDPSWTPNGKLSWFNGNHFFIFDPSKEISINQKQNIITSFDVPFVIPGAIEKEVIALTGADIITMSEKKIIENGTILIKNGRIWKVGGAEQLRIPLGAKTIKLEGRTIIPGFFDMHGHHDPPPDILVDEYYKLIGDLAFGITTFRDPAAKLDMYGYKELMATGKMIGPRLLPSFALGSMRFEIETYEDALDWVRREKQRGAISIKVHDTWSRRTRQFLVRAANAEQLNILGHLDGGTLSGAFDLSIFLDGFTGSEHAIRYGNLYKDAQELISRSGTWFTIAAISEFESKENFLQFFNSRGDMDIVLEWDRKEKLQEFLENENKISGFDSEVSMYLQDVAKISKSGGRLGVGSHQGIPGLPLHWEMWQLKEQGMDPLEVLQASTLGAARAAGLEAYLGSIEPEKLADMVVLNGNPLENIRNTANIEYIFKSGILYSFEGLMQKFSVLERQNN